jgi:hypothetical protein
MRPAEEMFMSVEGGGDNRVVIDETDDRGWSAAGIIR